VLFVTWCVGKQGRRYEYEGGGVNALEGGGGQSRKTLTFEKGGGA